MKDKPPAPERELPEVCRKCRSLYKKNKSTLCERRRQKLRGLELWGRLLPMWPAPESWECNLRKYETVEDIEREEKSSSL